MHTEHSRADALIRFIRKHGIHTVVLIIEHLNRGRHHKDIAALVKIDPAVMSKLLDRCFTCSWSLHPDIADLLNLYLDIERKQMNHALRRDTPVIPIRRDLAQAPAWFAREYEHVNLK